MVEFLKKSSSQTSTKLSFLELNSLCVLCALCDLCGGFRFVSPHPSGLDWGHFRTKILGDWTAKKYRSLEIAKSQKKLGAISGDLVIIHKMNSFVLLQRPNRRPFTPIFTPVFMPTSLVRNKLK